MSKNQELLFWKIVAFSAVGFYIYKMTKANGGSLSGTPLARISPDKVGGMAASFVPPEFQPHVAKAGSIVMNHLLGKLK